jgi:hypothetical protein
MFRDSRSYPWFVLGCSLASALLLWQAYEYDIQAFARCGGVPAMWFYANLLPGSICTALWIFGTRGWIRRAGVVASLGTVLFSFIALWLSSNPNRGRGDMGCILLLPAGAIVSILVVGLSLLAVLVSLAVERKAETANPLRPPDKPVERTRER